MPYPDLSQYVTRAELLPLAEIRTMLRDDIRALHEGQVRLGDQIADMNTSICDRMDEANGRTGKLEKQLDKTEVEAEAAAGLAAKILRDGCHQIEKHEGAVETLTAVGALLPHGEVARVEFSDERPVLALVKRHPKKTVAVGGGMLVGLGALLPHLIEFANWVAHLFTVKP